MKKFNNESKNIMNLIIGESHVPEVYDLPLSSDIFFLYNAAAHLSFSVLVGTPRVSDKWHPQSLSTLLENQIGYFSTSLLKLSFSNNWYIHPRVKINPFPRGEMGMILVKNKNLYIAPNVFPQLRGSDADLSSNGYVPIQGLITLPSRMNNHMQSRNVLDEIYPLKITPNGKFLTWGKKRIRMNEWYVHFVPLRMNYCLHSNWDILPICKVHSDYVVFACEEAVSLEIKKVNQLYSCSPYPTKDTRWAIMKKNIDKESFFLVKEYIAGKHSANLISQELFTKNTVRCE